MAVLIKLCCRNPQVNSCFENVWTFAWYLQGTICEVGGMAPYSLEVVLNNKSWGFVKKLLVVNVFGSNMQENTGLPGFAQGGSEATLAFSISELDDSFSAEVIFFS